MHLLCPAQPSEALQKHVLDRRSCGGTQATADKFLIYYLTLVLFTLTSETVGHLCAIATKTSHTGRTSLTAVRSAT